jgi:hypothetical protein
MLNERNNETNEDFADRDTFLDHEANRKAFVWCVMELVGSREADSRIIDDHCGLLYDIIREITPSIEATALANAKNMIKEDEEDDFVFHYQNAI